VKNEGYRKKDLLGVWCPSQILLLAPSDALAMHISEGILPFREAAFWFVVAAPLWQGVFTD
jgi:hypothetical protein